MVKMKRNSSACNVLCVALVALALTGYILTCMYIHLDSDADEATILAKLALGEISSNINASVDPCDDFYEFACGSFSQKYHLLNNKSEFNYYSIHLDQMYHQTVENLESDQFTSNETIEPLKYIKQIWDSCVHDNSSTSQVMTYMTEYFNELDKLDSWQSKFVKLTQDGYNVLFTVKTATHPSEVSEAAISSPEVAFSDVKSVEDVGPLLGYYSGLIDLFKIDISATARFQLAQVVVDFENVLRSITSSPREKAKDPPVLVVSMNEINSYTKMRWHRFLDEIFKVSEQPISRSFDFAIVEDIKYIKGFAKAIEGKDEAFLSDYMKLVVLHQSCFFLGRECRETHFQMAKGLKKIESEEEHVRRGCFDALKINLEPLLFKAYDPVWDDFETTEVENMTQLFVKEFKNLVSNFTWMDQDTKDGVIDPIEDVEYRLGVQAPSFLKSQLEVKAKYWDAPYFLEPEQIKVFDYFTSLLKYNRKKNYHILERNARSSWPVSLFSALPHLDHLKKHFYIPDFSINGPFSSPELPDQVRFGFLGSLLAHEITHSFDGLANKFAVASWRKLWSSWTKEKFEGKMKCLVDVYSRQNANWPSGKINGNSTLNENLADLIGLNMAFEIFKNRSQPEPAKVPLPEAIQDMDDDRLFFLSYANVHCSNDVNQVPVELDLGIRSPRKFRVNVPLAQSEKFAQAFKCKPGSKMNPVEKCSFI